MAPLPKTSKQNQRRYRQLLAKGFSAPVAAKFVKAGRSKFLNARLNG